VSVLKKIRHRGRVYLSFLVHFLSIQRYRRNVRRNNPDATFTAITLIEHLGDIVACEPVSRYIRSKEPGAKIIWMVKKEYHELLASNPCVDIVVDVHCLTEKDYLLKWCNFDQVFDLHFHERSCALCGRTKVQYFGVRENDREITLHNFYNYGCILQSMSQFAGLPPLNEPPRVYIDKNVKSTVEALRLPPRIVVFHCSSNTIEKDWPRDKWNQLARYIGAKYGYCVVEVGLHPILSDSGNLLYRNLAGKLSILETAEVIGRAKLFIGIDSGPAHMANAVGVKGVLLLGSYLGFKKYNPFSGDYGAHGNSSLIYADGPVAGIPFEMVQQSVDNALTHGMGGL